MNYTEMVRITTHHAMPIAAFLDRHDMVKRQAGNENPIDWLAGAFLPVADRGERFEAWVCRQVAEIVNVVLRYDTIRGANRHACHSVFNAAFDPEDREYLLRTLGQHPDVLCKWQAVQAGKTIAA